jgi:uncharacterized membrane protein (DUF106 family)
MRMKITNRVLTFALAVTLILSAMAAIAQTAKTEKPGDEKEMGGCPHMTATKASLDNLEKTLAAGRESNDPAKMKASLEKAQTELADARKEMSMCPMMNGGMHHHQQSDMEGMDHPDDGEKK